VRRRTVALGAVVLAGLVAGCVDDDDDGGDASASTSIEAEATEFAFEPDRWTIPAGETVTIEYENEGSVGHEWVIVRLGEELASEADFTEDKVLFEVEVVNPGTSVEQTFSVDEAGTYQVICAVAGHFDAGMEGELTVE
jgi:plastocyanin